MSSPFYVPIGPSTYTDVQPMYWVAGQWMVPSSHLAQVPITQIPGASPLGHTGHAVHPHRSDSLSRPYWSRHDLEPGQYREDVIPIPQFTAQAQGSSRPSGDVRRAPAPYHRPDRHSESSTQHTKAVSRGPIGHTQDSARTKSHCDELDQDHQPSLFSHDSTETRRAARRHQAHLDSEKRRRESINAGVEALRQVLPGTNESDSKAILLDKAVQYILHLESLLRESRSYEARAMGRGQSGEIDEVKTEVE